MPSRHQGQSSWLYSRTTAKHTFARHGRCGPCGVLSGQVCLVWCVHNTSHVQHVDSGCLIVAACLEAGRGVSASAECMLELGLQAGPWKLWQVILVHVIQWSCLCQPVVHNMEAPAAQCWACVLFVGRGLQSREFAVEGTWDVTCVPVAIKSGTRYLFQGVMHDNLTRAVLQMGTKTEVCVLQVVCA